MPWHLLSAFCRLPDQVGQSNRYQAIQFISESTVQQAETLVCVQYRTKSTQTEPLTSESTACLETECPSDDRHYQYTSIFRASGSRL